ncbi:MAG: FAD-dependent oxidoreductase [Deltaproteobacteria bacterium]|nr:MAG: FAD-dependent oxidoreductase [Deltaproteobacteria bacterium]
MSQPIDVAIVGGGFAGLTLARDLVLHIPNIQVAVVEKNQESSPPKRHKVGETSLIPQAIYLAERLQLKDYLEQNHLEKFGARYFFKNENKSFETRPEMGASEFSGCPEYQMDRTRLEADLIAMNRNDGVAFYMGTQVRKLDLSIDDSPHVLHLEQAGQALTLEANWLIDASGRRRLLPSSLNQTSTPKGPCSAAWMRVEGWIDVESFVPQNQDSWHNRVAPEHPRNGDFRRIYSTNHLVGDGYWVWLIPLTDDVMSVGIVVHEDFVPFTDINKKEKALQWFEDNEPALATKLKGQAISQFRLMRNYSYAPSQFVSKHRWFCIGESLGFADPLYASGGLMMTMQNLLAVETLARAHRGEELTTKRFNALNAYVSSHIDITTHQLHSLYPFLGYSRIAASRILWDMASLVSFHRQVIPRFGEGVYEFLSSPSSSHMLLQIHELNQSIRRQLSRWAEASTSEGSKHLLNDYQMLNQYKGVRSLLMAGMMQPMVMMVFGLGYLLCRLGFKTSGARLLAHSYVQTLRRIKNGLSDYVRILLTTPKHQTPKLSGMAKPWGQLLGID